MSNRPLKIGITGGIGSGKTTVCRIFEALGIPVYYADSRAKWLMVNDRQLINSIKNLLGTRAYLPDGSLNRSYISQLVFNDQSLLSQLNALVHPAVAEDTLKWHNEQREVPYTLKEAALLFESGSHLHLDKIIAVTAPEPLRIQRVMQRDDVSEAQVRSRIDKQMPEAEKIARADYIIYNDGQQLIVPQVLEIHHLLCKMK
jgi:dephospho-CoA kinase